MRFPGDYQVFQMDLEMFGNPNIYNNIANCSEESALPIDTAYELSYAMNVRTDVRTVFAGCEPL